MIYLAQFLPLFLFRRWNYISFIWNNYGFLYFSCSHAIESYTAIPFQMRDARPLNPNLRPAYQGSNPVSDVWSKHALGIVAKYLKRWATKWFLLRTVCYLWKLTRTSKWASKARHINADGVEPGMRLFKPIWNQLQLRKKNVQNINRVMRKPCPLSGTFLTSHAIPQP